MAPSRVVHVTRSDDGVAAHELREGIARIQEELEVTPDFPPEVVAAAEAAAASPRLPELDRTDLAAGHHRPARPPWTSTRRCTWSGTATGSSCYYAIADVAAFVTPGDPIDLEANRRGETLYGADSKVPLHPTSLSEGAASLLPGQVRPALLWTIKVDADGRGHRRARRAGPGPVHAPSSTTRACRRAIDDGSAAESLQLLKEVGRAAAGPRGRARRGVPAAARAGGRRWRASTGAWSSGPSCRPSSGTPRSPCSPGWPPPP